MGGGRVSGSRHWVGARKRLGGRPQRKVRSVCTWAGRDDWATQEVDLNREAARFWAGRGRGSRCALPDWDGSFPPPWHDSLELGAEESLPSEAELQHLLFEIIARGHRLPIRALLCQAELSFGKPLGLKPCLQLVATLSRAGDFTMASELHTFLRQEKKIAPLCRHYMWLAELRLADGRIQETVEIFEWMHGAACTPSADACELLVDMYRALHPSEREGGRMGSLVGWMQGTDVGRGLWDTLIARAEERAMDISTWETALNPEQMNKFEEILRENAAEPSNLSQAEVDRALKEARRRTEGSYDGLMHEEDFFSKGGEASQKIEEDVPEVGKNSSWEEQTGVADLEVETAVRQSTLAEMANEGGDLPASGNAKFECKTERKPPQNSQRYKASSKMSIDTAELDALRLLDRLANPPSAPL